MEEFMHLPSFKPNTYIPMDSMIGDFFLWLDCGLIYGTITETIDMSGEQKNNPLHGIKLADILEDLVSEYGWDELGSRIDIRCFNYDPSIKSSLRFLRRTPWAREKVEKLYLKTF